MRSTLLKIVAFASRSLSTFFTIFFGLRHLSNKRFSLMFSNVFMAASLSLLGAYLAALGAQ
jgi:hypothetical protein